MLQWLSCWVILSFPLGRAALKGAWDHESSEDLGFKRASNVINMMPHSEAEMQAIRNAMVNQEGLLLSVLDVLRSIPRRVLMVLKLNDLTRSVMVTHCAVYPSIFSYDQEFRSCTRHNT